MVESSNFPEAFAVGTWTLPASISISLCPPAAGCRASLPCWSPCWALAGSVTPCCLTWLVFVVFCPVGMTWLDSDLGRCGLHSETRDLAPWGLVFPPTLSLWSSREPLVPEGTPPHTPPPALNLAISAGNRPSGLSCSHLVVFFWHLLFSFLL